MQLCLSSSMWSDGPLSEALAAAERAGVAAIDLSASQPHPHLDLRRSDALEEARRVLREHPVLAISADHPDFPRLRDEGQQEAIRWTVRAIEVAAGLGTPVVGTSLGSTGVDAWESAWGRAVDGLRTVLRRTSHLGVRLSVELDVHDVLDSLRKARRLLEAIPDPRLGLTYDTGMLHFLRIPFKEALDVAGSRLHHVHLRDAVRSDYRRVIGRGEVSFPAIFRQLRQHGYEGALSIELCDTEARDRMPLADAVAESVSLVRQWLEI